MIGYQDALDKILEHGSRLPAEPVSLQDLPSRIAAEDIFALITQPPFSASAMDGYAVKFENAGINATLSVIGEAPAGRPFNGSLKALESVRVFTGSVIPDGADHVIIQENVERDEDKITIKQYQPKARNIRRAGIDFEKGDLLVRSGEVFRDTHGSLLAAANVSIASCTSRPRLAVFSNGDELIEPGGELTPGKIINSNHYGLCAMIKSWGGQSSYLGCAPDSEAALIQLFKNANQFDVIVPVGGASVGDYDYVKSAFLKSGGELIFGKVAVRPGKPTWFGKLNGACVIGLPGNPASALVTAALFLRPIIRKMGGHSRDQKLYKAITETPLKQNGDRETYLRACLKRGDAKLPLAQPFQNQDSSLITPISTCDVLIKRAINAPACAKGSVVEVIPFQTNGLNLETMNL